MMIALFILCVLIRTQVHSFFLHKSLNKNTILQSKPKLVFIDGSEGTTGLQVRDRLNGRDDIEILSAPSDLRKDEATRREYINNADAAILCLPDAASKEAVTLLNADNDHTVMIDASTAFRVDDEWTYGFPELSPDQREALKKSKRISNPGCYPTGFIALVRPLVDAGVISEGTKLTVNAISGYSGGGKSLMNLFEDSSSSSDMEAWSAYGFALKHKHLPEMAKYSGLNTPPIFQPQIAKFPQGMVVSVPLHYSWLKQGNGKKIHEVYTQHYLNSNFVKVMPYGFNDFVRNAFLTPDDLKNTNFMQLFVFDNEEEETCLLCARLDNLGKGASGAAVQNLNIALGLDEVSGLL